MSKASRLQSARQSVPDVESFRKRIKTALQEIEQVRQSGAAGDGGRRQVGSNDAFPEFKLHLPQCRPSATLGMHPGVVDENIETTEDLDGL